MTMNKNLYRLLTWLSPSFPIGAYAYSHGLESAVDTGLIGDFESVRNWIADLITVGNGQADLVFLSSAWHSANDMGRLSEIHELALAFQSTSEIKLETTAQGNAFLKAIADAWPCEAIVLFRQKVQKPYVYPVVVGVVARAYSIDQRSILSGYAHAFVANLVSAAVRLVPLGQTDGQKIIARLLNDVDRAIACALTTPVDQVANSCIMADIASMQHEEQYTRLFRS